MLRSLLKISLIVCCSVGFPLTLHAGATGGDAVVIAQVQAGAATVSPSGEAAATQEFISLYNNSSQAVDVTGWCLSNKAGTSFACLDAPATVSLKLAPHGYALIASDSFASRYKAPADAVFTTTNKTSGSLTGGSDTVSLLDANGAVIDSMGWTASLAGGSVLARTMANGIMVDTDTNADFKKLTSLVMPVSGISEETHVIDYCANLDGVQEAIPYGYEQVAGGRCVIDVCPNLDDVQEAVPADMMLDARGRCLYVMPRIDITELLPNVAGSDDGNEFIELYNPGDIAVDLARYRLQVGPNFEKTYAFPKGSSVPALSYASFTNSAIDFSLLNTSSRVRLVSTDDQVISESPLYTNPADDESWSLLDGLWAYTNQQTPGLPNLVSLDDDEADPVVTSSGAKACAANQYRNPDTGRCRLTVTASAPAPCKDTQYRSEETGRCRTIASEAVQKACADNQFRNPETGRCKKIASEDEVKDCGEGRERNPVTGRCRNSVSTAKAPLAGSGVKLVEAPAGAVAGWLVGGGVVLALLGYAALEWRREVGQFLYARFHGPVDGLRAAASPAVRLIARIRSFFKR